jgi:hypothetical protein
MMTGTVFGLMLFAFLRVVPAQQLPNAPGRGAQPGAPGQPGANPPGRGAQAPRESRVEANSDPMRRVWMRFEVKPDGTLGQGAAVYTVPADGPAGIPDGLKLDAAGNLFGTGPGGVWIISPEGKALGRDDSGLFGRSEGLHCRRADVQVARGSDRRKDRRRDSNRAEVRSLG